VLDVAEAIPLAGELGVEALEVVILATAAWKAIDDVDGPFAHLEERPRGQVQRQVQIEADTAFHQGGSVRAPFGRQEIESAKLIVAAKDPPRRAWWRIGSDWQIAIARNLTHRLLVSLWEQVCREP
jgi:hypothetical protein